MPGEKWGTSGPDCLLWGGGAMGVGPLRGRRGVRIGHRALSINANKEEVSATTDRKTEGVRGAKMHAGGEKLSQIEADTLSRTDWAGQRQGNLIAEGQGADTSEKAQLGEKEGPPLINKTL